MEVLNEGLLVLAATVSCSSLTAYRLGVTAMVLWRLPRTSQMWVPYNLLQVSFQRYPLSESPTHPQGHNPISRRDRHSNSAEKHLYTT